MVGLLVVGAAAMLLTRYRRLNVSPLPMRVTVMLTRRSTRELSDRMAALRREGCSLARISEETNVSISGISLELRRLDDPSLRRPPSRARQLSDTLVGLRERGLAMSQIAEETGLSVSSISAELLRRGVNTPGRRVRRARGSAGGARDGSRTAAVGQAGAPDASWQMDGRVRELRMQGGSVQQIAARVGAPPEWVWARLTAMHLTRPVRSYVDYSPGGVAVNVSARRPLDAAKVHLTDELGILRRQPLTLRLAGQPYNLTAAEVLNELRIRDNVVPLVGEPRRSADKRALSSGLQAQAREMASLWTRGEWTILELAERYNCTPSQVYYRVRRYGAGAEGRVVAPRGWGRRPGPQPNRATNS